VSAERGDLVDSRRVGRVGHRHHQLLADKTHRHRPAAPGGLGIDQIGGGGLHLEGLEVHVVDPVALRRGAGELILGDALRLDQHVRDGGAGAARRSHGLLDGLRGGKAELDDHVAEKALAPARGARGSHSWGRRGRPSALLRAGLAHTLGIGHSAR
jgi:hypothetical protein